jgi:hypothetical protein
MAADTIAGYIEGLLDGKDFKKPGHLEEPCFLRCSSAARP